MVGLSKPNRRLDVSSYAAPINAPKKIQEARASCIFLIFFFYLRKQKETSRLIARLGVVGLERAGSSRHMGEFLAEDVCQNM